MTSDEILAEIAKEHKVICLCGSTRFLAEFLVYQWALTRAGCVVLSVGCVLSDKDGENRELGRLLDRVHLTKIDMASCIFVVDPGGYVGTSTKGEIKYASDRGKPVYRLSELSPDEPPIPLEHALYYTYRINTFVEYNEDDGYVSVLELDR